MATIAVLGVSLLLVPAPSGQAASQSQCWPGEVWMTAEGYPFCALSSPQGGCYYCVVMPAGG